MTTVDHVAAFIDRHADAFRADLVKKAGLAAVCIADRMDLDEFVSLTELFEDPGPYLVAGAEYGAAFGEPVEVRTPALAFLRRSGFVAEHMLIGSRQGWFVFEPEEGDIHVLFGAPSLIRPRLPRLLPRIEAEWADFMAVPVFNETTRRVLAELRSRYTFGL
jgi:hypothetical protein